MCSLPTTSTTTKNVAENITESIVETTAAGTGPTSHRRVNPGVTVLIISSTFIGI